MQPELDEFTQFRLEKIAKRFADLFQYKGRKDASIYLNTCNIKEAHYIHMRKLINGQLALRGLRL